MALVARRRIVVGLAGMACVVALTGCGGSRVVAEDSACLRSHGWKVEQVAKGFFVATRGPEELSYGSSGIPNYAGTAGSTGVVSGKEQLRFVCFPKLTVEVSGSGHSSTMTLSSSPSG